MVSKEGRPAFGGFRISRRSFHPTGDGSLGGIKTEHAQFPINPRRSPGRVLNDHTEDQFPNLVRSQFLLTWLRNLAASKYENQSGASGRQFPA
jgi:hypothetical protein